MKNLIVNADDLGWTPGVNRGIEEAHRKGLVTSTSLLANGASFDLALEVVRGNPELGVGVHLNLSDGPPTAKPQGVRGLLSADGCLETGPEGLLLRIASRTLDFAEVEREWDAQIQKVMESDIQPTHLDGHKHVQMLPGLFEIALKLARKHRIRAIRVAHEESSLRAALASGKDQKKAVILKQGVQARGLKLLARDAREMAERAGVVTTDYFCGIAQTGAVTLEGVERMLEILPEGATEFMCHPGYADEELRQTPTRLQESRQFELRILTNAHIRKLVASQGIRLISYKVMGEVA
ncbi:MAG TPA: ChbG/HpnK family deacetylase [Candidatus Limnocylindrales bacterium]|nr:ChbG/HpnK family deacetylase [Candidatus Limnocylindrales bacterium]